MQFGAFGWMIDSVLCLGSFLISKINNYAYPYHVVDWLEERRNSTGVTLHWWWHTHCCKMHLVISVHWKLCLWSTAAAEVTGELEAEWINYWQLVNGRMRPGRPSYLESCFLCFYNCYFHMVKVHRFVKRPIVRSSPLKCSGMEVWTIFILQTHHACLHLVSIHCLVIAAVWLQSLLIYRPHEDEIWVGLVSWPTTDGLPIEM